MARNIKSKNTKRKRYFKIIAPDILDNVLIGKSFIYEASDLKGRTAKVNLMSLTKDMSHQNINVKFRVIGLNDKKEGMTELIGYEIMPSAVRRMVRVNRDKIDDSFALKTSDDIKVRIKPLIITQNNTSKDKRNKIIKVARYYLYNRISNLNYKDLVSKIIRKEIQNDLKKLINKIYPVRTLEIRVFEKEKRNKVKLLGPEDFKGIEEYVNELSKRRSNRNRRRVKKQRPMTNDDQFGVSDETEESKKSDSNTDANDDKENENKDADDSSNENDKKIDATDDKVKTEEVNEDNNEEPTEEAEANNNEQEKQE